MKKIGIQKDMELIITHPLWQTSILPWDLQTIFDLQLTLDDIESLENDCNVQIGECVLSLQRAIIV